MTPRLAVAEDMNSIYSMGFDAWGENATTEEYINACTNSEKYKLGKWYCIEGDNEILSSIIIYFGSSGLVEKYCSFGSIATSPNHRNKGYASHLIAESVKNLVQEQYLGIFLFSEVGTSLYSKHGFCQVPGYEKEGLMFLSINSGSQPAAPSHF